MFWTRRTHRQKFRIKMSLAVTPHGVDPESLQEWKAAWIQLWADEKEDQKKKTVTMIVN